MTVKVFEESIQEQDAAILIRELSAILDKITGDSGQSSFDARDLHTSRSVFLVARDTVGNALGCCALKELDEKTAELKRMYVREKGQGIGKLLLTEIEKKAKEFNYGNLVLETRKVNAAAVRFYLKNNYRVIQNYGKYANRDECVCFGKNLTSEK